MVDGDDPAAIEAGVVARTLHAHVTADVDARAVGARREQLAGHEVGGEALADATRVEAGVRRELHRRGVDVEPDAAAVASQHADAQAGPDDHGLERTVVAGPDEVAEHGGVEAPARPLPPVDGPAHELDRLS